MYSYIFVPVVSTTIGTRALPVSDPTLWNKLPPSIKSVEHIANFRRE